MGLAFSGGGIRSATFNLGVLQALADFGLLRAFDYLSTVSGGGYIGSWLAAWIHRQNVNEVCDRLRPALAGQPDREEPPEIGFLRQYSNYLTPRLGLFGADTWTFAGIYLRNVALNLTVLVPALTALLLVPVLLALSSQRLSHLTKLPFPLQSLTLLLAAFLVVVANLSSLFEVSGKTTEEKYLRSRFVFLLVIVPVLASAWWLADWLWTQRTRAALDWLTLSALCAVAYAGVWIVSWLVGELCKLFLPQGAQSTSAAAPVKTTAASSAPRSRRQTMSEFAQVSRQKAMRFGVVLLTAFVSGGTAGILLYGLLALGRWLSASTSIAVWQIGFWSVPLVLLIFLMAETLHIGLAGAAFSEEAREWWGRLGGTFLLWSATLTGFVGLALYGPLLLEKLGEFAWAQGWLKPGLLLGWLATTGVGILAGKSPATGGAVPQPVLDLLGRVAPHVFVIGLLLLLASLNQAVLPAAISATHQNFCAGAQWLHARLGPDLDCAQVAPSKPPVPARGAWEGEFEVEVPGGPPPHSARAYLQTLERMMDPCVLIFLVGILGVSLLLSWRVGVNDFSTHALYRNRLVRCYLGGARCEQRNAHPFTGFDPLDNALALAALRATEGYTGPYPLINTALNLVKGENLAWQQRKAASFVFAPCFSGYEVDRESRKKPGTHLGEHAYRDTGEYAESVPLGTAMTISGAAASPNMGYHSAPSLAFLMTVFNVRLGCWVGNPRHAKSWRDWNPDFGLFYLLCELLGATNDRRRYVYLSDGGHFENLGIYELVRRRCGLIVACDAAEDHEMKFGDLGNAVEKCRADFGVDIEIQYDRIRRKENGYSEWHCVTGTIRYDKVDPAIPPGTLLYFKSSLTDEEPANVKAYAAQFKGFPHQSTADQWFSESQFESYRTLGYHVASTALEAVASREELPKMEPKEIFTKLAEKFPSEAKPSA